MDTPLAFDGRLLGEHDGDVVAHRVDPLALGAAEPRASFTSSTAVLQTGHARISRRSGWIAMGGGAYRKGPRAAVPADPSRPWAVVSSPLPGALSPPGANQ